MPIEKIQSKIKPDEFGGLKLNNKVEVGKLSLILQIGVFLCRYSFKI